MRRATKFRIAAAFATTIGCGTERATEPRDAPSPPLAWIRIEPARHTIAPGGSAVFAATASLSGAMLWSSSDTTVARIVAPDRGTVQGGQQTGAAMICATSVADAALKACATVRVTSDDGF